MRARWFFSWLVFMSNAPRHQLQVSDLDYFDIQAISAYSKGKTKLLGKVQNALLKARRETEYSLAYIMKEGEL